MFEQLRDVRQPEVTRKSVSRLLVMIFLLGILLGARLMKLAWHDKWQTWNPFEEVGFWFLLIPICVGVWRYIPAILRRVEEPKHSSGEDAL